MYQKRLATWTCWVFWCLCCNVSFGQAFNAPLVPQPVVSETAEVQSAGSVSPETGPIVRPHANGSEIQVLRRRLQIIVNASETASPEQLRSYLAELKKWRAQMTQQPAQPMAQDADIPVTVPGYRPDATFEPRGVYAISSLFQAAVARGVENAVVRGLNSVRVEPEWQSWSAPSDAVQMPKHRPR